MTPLFDTLEPRRLMAAGDIDSSFPRVAASVNTPYTDLSQSRAIDVAYDIDGSTVMLASVERNGVRLPVLTRFKPDGSTDYAFGRDGIVLIDLGVASLDAKSLAIDGGRRINVFSTVVTTGATTPRAMITQFNRTGKLTTSFGTGGNLLPAFASGSGAADITTDPLTNTIYALSDRGEVLRASPNGRVYAPFGNAGIVKTLGAIGASGVGESIWTDGTKVLVGTTLNTRNGSTDWCVTQLRIGNGSYERAFGRRGFASVDVAGGKRDQLDMITVDSYGRIMLAGKGAIDTVPPTGEGQTLDAIAAVARLMSDGTLDSRFYRTGIADGYKLGIARERAYESYECTFDGAPVLIGEQQDVYRLFAMNAEVELTLSGREWQVEQYPPLGFDPGYATVAIAHRDKELWTAINDPGGIIESSQKIGLDTAQSLISVRRSDGVLQYVRMMPLDRAIEPVSVGADGRVLTVGIPGNYSVPCMIRRNPDGSVASDEHLAEGDRPASIPGVYDGVAIARPDGGFEVVYAYSDPVDSDGGAYMAWSVEPTGMTVSRGNSFDESSREALVKLPVGRYSVTTIYNFDEFAKQIVVSGANFAIDTYRYDEENGPQPTNVMPIAPSYAVPIIGSNDLFAIGRVVNGPQYIGRYVDSETLSPAFSNGQPLEINGVDLLYGQADGRLLYTVLGQKGLRRLNTDGTGDSTFGTGGGWMASGFDHFDIDSKGRLIAWRVLTGGASDGDVQIMRFSQNGKIDTTFGGGDGLIIVDARLPSTATANVVIDTNDNLVVTAYRQSASAISWSATRILGD